MTLCHGQNALTMHLRTRDKTVIFTFFHCKFSLTTKIEYVAMPLNGPRSTQGHNLNTT